MKRAAALSATVLLTVGTASACGGSASPSVTVPASSAAAAPLPSGWQRATAPKAKLSLGVPGDWTVVTGASVASNAGIARRMAQFFHVSVTQVPQLFKQVDIMAFAPKITDNFDPNINVTLTPLADLPTAETIRAGYEQLHASAIKVVNVSTSLGNGVGVTYELSQVHARGEEIYVRTDAGIAGITVSTAASADPAPVMAQIMTTLQAKN